MPREAQDLANATRPLAAARPCHARLTRQRKVSSAKGRVPTPNLASGGRGKEPSLGDRLAKGGDPRGKRGVSDIFGGVFLPVLFRVP